MYRCSPLEAPQAITPGVAGGKNRLQTRLGVRPNTRLEVPSHFEPVSGQASELGHFVTAHVDLSRLRFLQVDVDASRAPYLEAEDIREKLWPHGHHTTDPQPAAILRLYGGHYDKYAQRDKFVCQLGVFPVRSGARIIQAHPASYATLCSRLEYESRDDAINELFDPLTGGLQDYTRINVGVMGPEGDMSEVARPFNTRAFGCDILPLLHRISDPEAYPASTGAFIQIHRGVIEEF